jgi:hypothetical protein
MNELSRVTNWLPANEYGWLKAEKERLDGDPSGNFKCSIKRSETGTCALFYDKIYFKDGEMFTLHQYDRIEDKGLS